MARIPDDIIDEVLRSTDIAQIVQQYVTLKKAGSNLKGLCPFHGEKTPSFNVHQAKGIYKCFGCGAGGNAIGFLMAIEGWSFPETVRQLAEKHGIEIPEESREDQEKAQRKRDGKKLYLRIMQLSKDFFENSLWSPEGRAAQLYLSERGIDEETSRDFGIGLAPAGWQNLIDHLEKNDIPARYTERAGMAISRQGKDGYYDRFRHRIMFPIRDIWGNTLAFGGRVFASDDDAPKYINSPETAFYTKGHQLYGLYEAKKTIQKEEQALLVEGNFDVIALHAQGVKVAIAPMGTALTGDQARLLGRYCRNAVVAFDGDKAGKEATRRCMPALESHGIEARVIRFAETEDPDTFVRSHGRDALDVLITEAPAIVAWALNDAIAPAEGAAIEKKLHALEAASEVLREVKSPVSWEFYAQEISRRLAIEPDLLKEYIRRPKSTGDKVRRAVEVAYEPLGLDGAEFGLLVVLLEHPEWIHGFLAEKYDNLLSSKELADFFHLAAERHQTEKSIEPSVILQYIHHPGFKNTLEEASNAQDLFQEEKAPRFYQDCVRAIKRTWADRSLATLNAQLDALNFSKEKEAFQELMKEKMQFELMKQNLKKDVLLE